MAQILFKRGNTAQNNAFTGDLGVITIDTQTRQIRVHDGVTSGGHAMALDATVTSINDALVALAVGDISGLQAALDSKLDDTQLGAVNGVAPLDSGGKVPTVNLPDSVLGQLEYIGVWNSDTNTPAIVSSTGSKGNYYKVSVPGVTIIDGTSDWKIGDWIVFNGATWDKIDNTESVSSVSGRTGVITLTSSDVGLGNVDNTTDANKPVSTAMQTALNLKATLASPALTGSPTAPTPLPSDNTTNIATTAFVQTEIGALDTGVTDVNGRTGSVSLTATDVALGNVGNYPISTSLEATAAVVDVAYMTPKKTKELIETATYTVDLGTF